MKWFTFFSRVTQTAIVIGQEAGRNVTGGHVSPRDRDVTPEARGTVRKKVLRRAASEVCSNPRYPLQCLI